MEEKKRNPSEKEGFYEDGFYFNGIRCIYMVVPTAQQIEEYNKIYQRRKEEIYKENFPGMTVCEFKNRLKDDSNYLWISKTCSKSSQSQK